MDSIILKDLEISCIIGIYPHEREKEQSIFLDLILESDLNPSAKSDNIKDTLDYDKVAETANQLARQKKYQLIETFAHELNEKILNDFTQISKCTTTVKKPAAVPKARYAAVTCEKSRS